MDIRAAGDNARPIFQERDDTRDGSVPGRRWQGDDGLSVFSHGGSTYEIHLSAETAVDVWPNGIGADLPGQINLDSGIHRNHLFVLRDDQGIICVIRRMQLKNRIVVHVVVQVFSAEDESSYDFARVQGLFGSCYESGFHSFLHAVRYHLRMNAQVFFIPKGRQNGIRDAADPQLQGRSVLNHFADILADPFFHFRVAALLQNRKLLGYFDDLADRGDVYKGVSQCTGHLFVDLDDNVFGILKGRPGSQNFRAQAHESMLIGHCRVKNDHIDRHLP